MTELEPASRIGSETLRTASRLDQLVEIDVLYRSAYAGRCQEQHRENPSERYVTRELASSALQITLVLEEISGLPRG